MTGPPHAATPIMSFPYNAATYPPSYTKYRHSARGQNEKWPTNGPGGYITSAIWGVPNKGTKSEVHNPCQKRLLSFFSFVIMVPVN